MGSGAIPLATLADHRAFVAAAAGDRPGRSPTTATRRTSWPSPAPASSLDGLPDLPADNELPRWLAENAGIPVEDLGHRWRLNIDIDGPLDLVLLGGAWPSALSAAERSPVDDRLARLRAVAADPAAELVVAGRTSAATLRWLERSTASRTRAIVEERGLRTSRRGQRPPASILGALLDRDGPASLGDHLARLGDGAVIDSRVLLANRLGADEAAWPAAEDRFASDLLLPDRIGDPWLRELTLAAAGAPIPILLGGHSLVGPGVRLALKRRPREEPAVDLTPGLRREAAPDLAAVGQDEELAARIHAEIETAGPITFARFMELALYDPAGGYYRAEAARPGREGDFLTAPETHPIFGAALARGWPRSGTGLDRPDPFVLREYGAGTGTLALAILDGLERDGSPLAGSTPLRPDRDRAATPRDDRHASRRRRPARRPGPARIERRPDARGRARQRGPRRPADPSGRRPRRRPA